MQTDLEMIRDELATERRRLDQQERAPFDGRLGDNVDEWVASMARRHARIAELEALEESAVELAEGQCGELVS